MGYTKDSFVPQLSINTNTHANAFDVSGAAAFGTYGGSAAPTNGLVVSGNLGSGTINPTGQFESVSASYPPARATRTSAITNGVRSAISCQHLTSADMINGFASSITFDIQDSAAVVNSVADIGGVRAGADNTGDMIFRTYSTGTATEKMRLTSTGGVAIGTYAGNNTPPTNGLIVSGSVGFGTTSPLSALDINGGLAIGSYAGSSAAPSGGIIASGLVGIGTNIPSWPLEVSATTRIGTFFGGSQTTTDGSNQHSVVIQSSLAPASATTNADGLYSNTTFVGTSGTITHASGLRVGNQITSTVTNSYGIKVDAAVGSVTNSYGGYFTQPANGATSNSALYSDRMAIGYTATTPPTNGLIVSGTSGIGTNSPNSSYNLHLSGSSGQQLLAESTSGTGRIVIQVPAAAQGRLDFIDGVTSKWQLGKNTDNNFFLFSNNLSTNSIRVTTASNQVFLSESQGAVGILTSAISSGVDFQVNGTSYFDAPSTAALDSGIRFQIGDPLTGNRGGTRCYKNSATLNEIVFSSTHANSGSEFRHAVVSGTEAKFNFSGKTGMQASGAFFAPVNALDISGAAVIGASYAGVNTAPTNGLLVQGQSFFGTTSALFTEFHNITPTTSFRMGLYIGGSTRHASAAYGFYIDTQMSVVDAGSTTSTALFFPNLSNSGGGTVTNHYGVLVAAGSMTSITPTNSYGGYFITPVAGTNKAALYADNGSIGFTGVTPPTNGLIVSGDSSFGANSPGTANYLFSKGSAQVTCRLESTGDQNVILSLSNSVEEWQIFNGQTDGHLVFWQGSNIARFNRTSTDFEELTGNVSIETAGKGLDIKEGSNARMGTAVLDGGATATVTVNTTAVTANSRIFITGQTLGTITMGAGYSVSARVAGTSFTITSSMTLDTSTVAWIIFEPA